MKIFNTNEIYFCIINKIENEEEIGCDNLAIIECSLDEEIEDVYKINNITNEINNFIKNEEFEEGTVLHSSMDLTSLHKSSTITTEEVSKYHAIMNASYKDLLNYHKANNITKKLVK